MALDINSLQSLGLPEIVLWMLSFSIVYGLLSQIGEKGTPQSKASRVIIGIVIAFFVLMSAPASIINVLSNMTSGLVLILVGILVLAIFLEVSGLHKRVVPELDEKGKPTGEMKTIDVSIFQEYGYIFAIAFIIIAALIFVNSGGLQLLGWNINLSSAATTTTAFFIFIILAVLWMIADKK